MKRARELLGSARNKLGDLLTDLEQKIQLAETREKELKSKLADAVKRESEASRLEESLRQKREKIIAEAYQYAGEVMKGANRRIEEARSEGRRGGKRRRSRETVNE